MKPMLDPKRDLWGATPETLARALFRRIKPLRPSTRRKAIVSDEIYVQPFNKAFWNRIAVQERGSTDVDPPDFIFR